MIERINFSTDFCAEPSMEECLTKSQFVLKLKDDLTVSLCVESRRYMRLCLVH